MYSFIHWTFSRFRIDMISYSLSFLILLQFFVVSTTLSYNMKKITRSVAMAIKMVNIKHDLKTSTYTLRLPKTKLIPSSYFAIYRNIYNDKQQFCKMKHIQTIKWTEWIECECEMYFKTAAVVGFCVRLCRSQ